MKKLLLFVLFTVYGNVFSQNYKITYQKSSNGTLLENQDLVLVFTNFQNTLLTSEAVVTGKSPFPFEETLMDRTSNSFIQIANLKPKEIISTKDSLSLKKQTFEFLPETKKILGCICKKAKTIVNSNTIEFWYTNDLKVKGSPSVLGQNLGLVLEIVRNGNFVVTATKIEKVKVFPSIQQEKKSIDPLTYKDLL